jgi:hypothetical protein
MGPAGYRTIHEPPSSLSDEFRVFDPDQPSGWDEADFAAFVASHRWIFAKTMPYNPHEYTLRREAGKDDFDAAVRYIREHGKIELYGGHQYKTLRHSDHKYWTMGEVVEKTILINRKHTGEALLPR